jgi:APA family basic amino acid/polyamine antiporter
MKDTFFGRLATALSFTDLFRTKPVEELERETEEPGHQLRRVLGPIQITLLGIGAIIGAGIFATIGTAAAGDAQRPGAGPALMLSFVITAVVCAFTALCYAEFAAMVPVSGSAYTYSYASFGELIAWVIGWDLIIEYAVGNIAVAVSWANYFKTLLKGLQIPVLCPDGILVPDWLSTDYRTAAKLPGVIENAPHIFGVPIVINLLAVGIVVAITAILIIGIRESAWFNAVMVAIKIVVLTFFIVVGYFWVKPDNWVPFAPNGFHGISAGAAIVFFAYIGFDAVSTVAEETRNPQRNMPIGILASLIICTLFYVVVSAIFTGLITYPDLKEKLASEQAEPLTMALEHVGANWAVGFVAFGSVIAHTAVLLVYQLGQPRIFMAMARDGLLPPVFARVHPRFRTPHVATILTGVFVAVFAAFASIDEMVDLTNIGTLFAFILVCAGIIVLRVKEPDRPRPFRVPSGWRWSMAIYAVLVVAVAIAVLLTTEVDELAGRRWLRSLLAVVLVLFLLLRNHIIPALGIASCLYLVYFLPPTSWLRFAAWLNVGFVIFIGYGTLHSRLTGRAQTTQPEEHAATTAWAGLWLAVLGVGMLLFMRWLDLWLAAFEKLNEAGLEFAPRMVAAQHDALQADSWLRVEGDAKNSLLDWLGGALRSEIFWFMLLPLALNAFVLCPIVVRRALSTKSLTQGGPYRRRLASIWGGGALALAILIYFAVLYSYDRGLIGG